MKNHNINSINFDVGRGIFPSSNAENWLDIIRASRQDPIHNYTYNSSIKGMGDVKTPLPYQAVQGGFNIINPAIQTVRQIPFVSEKHRTPVKTENRRKDRQTTEALYDIRNNTSLNNATRVPPNYYLDKLKETAKGRVRMTNTAEAMRVQYSNPGEDFYQTGNERVDTYIQTPKYSMESFNVGSKDDGILRFADLSYPGSSSNFGTGSRNRVETPDYNPFLPQSSLNKSHTSPGTPAYPDERMTRYSGERKYMTKGDRILMAADLAKSDYMKERRQLQAQAHDALNKAGHAPRMFGADLSKGINTLDSYSLTNSLKSKGVLSAGEMSRQRGMKHAGLKETAYIQEKPMVDEYNFISDRIIGNGLSEDISGVSSRRKAEIEAYVPRSHDFNRQQDVQNSLYSASQNTNNYFKPGIEKIRQELNDADVVRKLYAEQFGNNPHNQKAVQDKGLIYKFVDTFKGWFGAKNEDEEAFTRIYNSPDDLRKRNGNIDAKTFKETVKNLEILLRDDSLSIQQRQAFDTDLRTQIKEYLEDYNDSVKQDLIINSCLNKIGERCIINDSGNRILDEDKFIKEVLSSNEIMDRLDELKVRTAKNLMTEDKYIYLRNVCEEYDENIISNWLDDKVDELNNEFNYRKIKTDPYYTERGVKEKYEDGILENKLIEVVKPISVLMNGNNEVVRGILIKDFEKDKYMLLQRKEYGDGINKQEYIISKLEPDEVMKILNIDDKKLKMDQRFGDVVDLTFEEHIKLNSYVDKVKDKDFIVVSQNPIHPYQRDLLNDDSNILKAGVISNVVLGGIDEGLINKEKYRNNQNIIEHSSNIASFKGGDGNEMRIYNQLEGIRRNDNDRVNLSGRTQNEYDQKKVYKRFGDMM